MCNIGYFRENEIAKTFVTVYEISLKISLFQKMQKDIFVSTLLPGRVSHLRTAEQ